MRNYLVQIDCGFNGKIYLDTPYDKVPRLDTDNKELILVLDPSSKQTGIALGTEDRELKMFADFKNKACTLLEYKSYLNQYLYKLSNTYKISKFVYEVPFSMHGDVASEVLFSLERTFREYTKVITGLTKDNMYPILPGVWRKRFFADEKYKGRRTKREDLKEAAREECSLLYPEYMDYFYETKYVPDSTDAIGIYRGFIDEYWYDYEKKIKRVSKINSRYNRNHKYNHEILNDTLDNITRIANYRGKGVEIYAYNSEYSYETNCEIVTSQTDSTCILLALDSLSWDLLKWQADKDVNNECLIALITNRIWSVERNEI